VCCIAASSAAPGQPRRRHRLRGKDSIELLVGEQFSRASDLTNGHSSSNRFFRDLGRRGIADVRAQRGRESRAPVEQPAAALFVRLDSFDTSFEQDAHRLPQNVARVDGVPREHRHHDVQFQLPAVGRAVDCRVAPRDLIADLVHHLGHGRIHFARHDR